MNSLPESLYWLPPISDIRGRLLRVEHGGRGYVQWSARHLGWVLDGDRHYTQLPGEFMSKFQRRFAPKDEEIRGMLAELRSRCRWPDSHLAAVLGVPKITLRRWEHGRRNPSAAARKLIWLVHALFTQPGTLRNDGDLATWGGKCLRAGAEEIAAMTREYGRCAGRILSQGDDHHSEGSG